MTGVQTCALPICVCLWGSLRVASPSRPRLPASGCFLCLRVSVSDFGPKSGPARSRPCVSVSRVTRRLPLSVHPGVCPSPSFPSVAPPGLFLLQEALPGASVPLQGVRALALGRPGARHGRAGAPWAPGRPPCQLPRPPSQLAGRAGLRRPKAFVFPHRSLCTLALTGDLLDRRPLNPPAWQRERGRPPLWV